MNAVTRDRPGATGRPHVLIDGYFLGKPYGFGRFICELCRALGRAESDLRLTVVVPARINAEALPHYPGLRWHRLPDANFVLWEQVLIPLLARRLGCDAIHFPYNTRAFFTLGRPSVTTVHDLLFLGEQVPLRNVKAHVMAAYSRVVFRGATRRSRALVSVSDTTRRALLRVDLPSTTVYNTVDGFLETAGTGEGPPCAPYLLHRGGYQAHRNTARVIEAFRRVRRACPHVELLILGAPRGAQVWGQPGDAGIHFLPRVSDEELAGLYRRCLGVIATSLQEGFGLPIIEGFGFGVPVVTSRRDPMMEVAGDAALLVDPDDVADIAAAMLSLIAEPDRIQPLVARGTARREVFASHRVAERMLQVYRAMLDRQPARRVRGKAA